MTGMMMVEHETIPIQRIISVACRNFMAFDGLHTFNFDEGVNTIVGGNSSGKSSHNVSKDVDLFVLYINSFLLFLSECYIPCHGNTPLVK